MCPTLCDPINCSPPGSSVHGILQARTLEWVATSFSKKNYRKKESEVAQSCPTLCNPQSVAHQGSPVHGILQARTLEWVVISFSKRKHRKKESEFAQSCLTLFDPMDCSLPGSSIHGIFQARVLEWVAIFFVHGVTKIRTYLAIKQQGQPSHLTPLSFISSSVEWE